MSIAAVSGASIPCGVLEESFSPTQLREAGLLLPSTTVYRLVEGGDLLSDAGEIRSEEIVLARGADCFEDSFPCDYDFLDKHSQPSDHEFVFVTGTCAVLGTEDVPVLTQRGVIRFGGPVRGYSLAAIAASYRARSFVFTDQVFCQPNRSGRRKVVPIGNLDISTLHEMISGHLPRKILPQELLFSDLLGEELTAVQEQIVLNRELLDTAAQEKTLPLLKI